MNKFIKSFAMVFFAGAALMSAGCGGDQAADGTSIKVAYWGGPEEMQIMQTLIDDWKVDHPDVEVRLEHTPFSAYVSRLLTRIAGGVAPDIMAIEVNLFPRLLSKGAFSSLQSYIDNDPEFDINEFFPTVVDRFSLNGEVYAIPRDTAPFACVFYNKTLFDEAGIPYPNDEWSWDDLLRVSQQLTKKADNGRVTQYGFYAWAWQNFVYSNGGNLVDDLRNPTKTLLDDPRSIQGLQFYADLMNKYEVAPTPVALGNLAMGAQQLFMTQRVAMFSSGYWEVPMLRNIKDFEWDVVMFPKGPNGMRAFGSGGTAYALLQSSDNPDLAWQVLKALAGKRGQKMLAETGLAQPANRVVAAGPAFAQSTDEPQNKEMLIEAVRYSVYEPFIPEWQEIFELNVLPVLDMVFHGKITAAEAAERIAPKVNKALRERKSSSLSQSPQSNRLASAVGSTE